MSLPKLHIGWRMWPGLAMVVAAVAGILYGMSTSRPPPPILATPSINDIKTVVDSAVAPVREDVRFLMGLARKFAEPKPDAEPVFVLPLDEPPRKKKKRRGSKRNTGDNHAWGRPKRQRMASTRR
ncbi:MAG: hypothetical protein EHM35_07420 [Planctomycetaceae bacterium]|nr:MAG: hypothetical protein EHM35_07420 [Planctomycetaceae bacterium]